MSSRLSSALKDHAVIGTMSSLLSSRAEVHAIIDSTMPIGHSIVSDREDAISHSGSMMNTRDAASETISPPNLSSEIHPSIVRINR